MFLANRLRFASHEKHDKRRRSVVLARSGRLHAERLEDRFMMSADDPATVVAADLDATEAGAVLAGTHAAPLQMMVAHDVTTTETAHSALQRFESTAEFEAWLVEAAVAQWGHLFGQSTYHHGWNWLAPIQFFNAIDVATPLALGSTGATGGSDADFSRTNVQVAGVDEADLVKTDGEYLYIISGQDLVIVKAGVGDELEIMSRVRLDERPVGMYVSGDRLALVSSSGSAGWGNGVRMMPVLNVAQLYEHEAKPPTTTVTVLDITDRAAPTLVQKTELDGQLVTSRTVDGQLRLVLTNEIRLPMPITPPVENVADDTSAARPLNTIRTGDIVNADIDMIWWPDSSPAHSVYETQEEYVARVRDEILDAIRPQTRSLALDGSVISETPLFDPTEVYRPESLFDRHVTTIATFDLTSNESGPAATASIMAASPAQVYATADSFYVFAQQAKPHHSVGLTLWAGDQSPATSVWKFDIDAQTHAVDLVAKGHFEGTLLNQFAADEQEGYLRVVAQADGWSSAGQSLHVLQQEGDELKIVATMSGIAPNEVLYSVRFVGDRAFFVTFRKVDPLFAVDLSDPENPELLGELHIPGYSDYLQPIDENHLLAIGRGADESTGLFEELQVSIFDVSDLTDPQLVHRYSFEGGRSTATPATGDRWTRGDGDHHAVSYFASEQIFAMPIVTADNFSWWGGGQDATLFEAGQGGLQVFQIDVEAGFTPLGVIEHLTLVERSVQIGDHLYAISSSTLSVHELTNPAADLGELSLVAESDAAAVGLRMYRAPQENVSLRTDEAGSERPAQRARWRLAASERSNYAPPVRAAAFANFAGPSRLDADLVQVLAVEATSAVVWDDPYVVDSLSADDENQAGQDSDSHRSSRGPFRPLGSQVGLSLDSSLST